MRRAREKKERSELIAIFSVKARGQGVGLWHLNQTRTSRDFIIKNFPVVKTFDLIVA